MLSLSMSEANTGIAYWEGIRVCELKEWLELFAEEAKRRERLLKRKKYVRSNTGQNMQMQ